MSGVDSDLIRGHIDTIILKVLSEGDKYGYEICKDVEEKSGGTYELKQPTLYSCLKRLEGQGLISSYWKDSDIGGKRHYYKLTDQGKEAYRKNQEDWLRSRQIIDNLISNTQEIASSYSLVKKEDIEELEKKAELAEELSEFIQESEPSVYAGEIEEINETAQIVEPENMQDSQEVEEIEVKQETVQEVDDHKTEQLVNNTLFEDEEEFIIPWGAVTQEVEQTNDNEIEQAETIEDVDQTETEEDVTYSWNRFVDLSNDDQKVLVEVAPNGEETAVYVQEVQQNQDQTISDEEDEIIQVEQEIQDDLEQELSPAQGSIFEEEVAFVDEEQNQEEIDILALLGHTTPAPNRVEQRQEELIEYTQEPELDYTEELLIEQTQEQKLEYHEEPKIEYSQKQEVEEQQEEYVQESAPFSFNMEDFVAKSRNSYFESEEDSTPDYIAPTMKVDKQEQEENVSDFDFEEFSNKHRDQDDEIYSPINNYEQPDEPEQIYSAPVYHDYGASSFNPYESEQEQSNEDDIYVDTSSVSDDEIYLNPPQDDENDNELKLFSEDIFEENNMAKADEINYVDQEESHYLDNDEIIRPVNKAPMEFYKSTENYNAITPKFTEDEYKEKISSLMSYTNDKEQYDIKEASYSFDSVPKDYADLKAEFEREGLVVRTHHKMVKESRHTRSYIETNKLNLVNSWTAFGYVAFLISLTYIIMSNYAGGLTSSYDFSIKYFLMGIGALAFIPVLYTLIFFINPYKKKPARYASRVYLLFAILLTVQFLLIIYCVNLQVGFYSFTQANYNHLFWIIPSLMSLYPLFDAILHTIYFNSKNFHV